MAVVQFEPTNFMEYDENLLSRIDMRISQEISFTYLLGRTFVRPVCCLLLIIKYRSIT